MSLSLAVWYYSYLFISTLFILGKSMQIGEKVTTNREDIKRHFSVFCASFLCWSFVTVLVGIVNNNVLDILFLFTSEFFRIGVFINGAELMAAITDRTLVNKKTLFSISSIMLYCGVTILLLKLFLDRATKARGVFGDFLAVDSNIALIAYIMYYVIVLFFYATYVYMHYYASGKKRDYYITKLCVIIVSILGIALVIESFAYAMFRTFVPTIHIAMLICIVFFNKLIKYKRSIEHHEADYDRILTPTYNKPAFVCDDEGKIIFENTRAFVMCQTYKDTYLGKYLTDVFDISDYDRERLMDAKLTQAFEIYCNYSKEKREILLTIKHNIDRFGAIFTTEVELEYADEKNVNNSNINDEAASENRAIYVTYENIKRIRTEQLIEQLGTQKELYDNNNKDLFEFGIKGISKSAKVLSLMGLEELCDRIQEELSYGEWESLEPLMIELDRQYESLKLIS